MTFPGERCSWCSEGHTPGDGTPWLPPIAPDASLDAWLSYRTMTTPDRIAPDGTITLRCPPLMRVALASACLVGGIALAAWIIGDGLLSVATVVLLAVCALYVVAGVRTWRARIRIRPDRLEMRGVLRSRVVLRADVERIGIDDWGYVHRSEKCVALQLRDGATVFTPLTVQSTPRSVRALFDLLTQWLSGEDR